MLAQYHTASVFKLPVHPSRGALRSLSLFSNWYFKKFYNPKPRLLGIPLKNLINKKKITLFPNKFFESSRKQYFTPQIGDQLTAFWQNIFLRKPTLKKKLKFSSDFVEFSGFNLFRKLHFADVWCYRSFFFNFYTSELLFVYQLVNFSWSFFFEFELFALQNNVYLLKFFYSFFSLMFSSNIFYFLYGLVTGLECLQGTYKKDGHLSYKSP